MTPTEAQLRVLLAYEHGVLTQGQAKALLGLDVVEFREFRLAVVEYLGAYFDTFWESWERRAPEG